MNGYRVVRNVAVIVAVVTLAALFLYVAGPIEFPLLLSTVGSDAVEQTVLNDSESTS